MFAGTRFRYNTHHGTVMSHTHTTTSKDDRFLLKMYVIEKNVFMGFFSSASSFLLLGILISRSDIVAWACTKYVTIIWQSFFVSNAKNQQREFLCVCTRWKMWDIRHNEWVMSIWFGRLCYIVDIWFIWMLEIYWV